jgi:hypothetical protein
MAIGGIVTKRDTTPLVATARAKGCRTVPRRKRLREQIPLVLEYPGLPPQT